MKEEKRMMLVLELVVPKRKKLKLQSRFRRKSEPLPEPTFSRLTHKHVLAPPQMPHYEA